VRKLLTILLAILMLISNIGISINTHYCSGHQVAQSLSFGISDLDCGMNNMDQTCDHDPNKNTLSKSCCKNVHQLLQVEDSFVMHATASGINPFFVIAFVQTIAQERILLPAKQQFFTNYHIPPPKKSAQVLFQTFLI